MVPVSTINLWNKFADISAYLAENDNQSNALFKGGSDYGQIQLSFLLNFYSDLISWAKLYYIGNEGFDNCATFMYELCGQYLPRAAKIVTNVTGEVITNFNSSVPIKVPYELAAYVGQAGGPVAGTSTYQLNALIGASDLNTIVVAQSVLQSLGPNPQFSFDPVTGTINIAPNQWVTDDALTGNYTKTN